MTQPQEVACRALTAAATARVDGQWSMEIRKKDLHAKVARQRNGFMYPRLPVIPPEAWCLIGMFLGFKYLQTQGAWKSLGV